MRRFILDKPIMQFLAEDGGESGGGSDAGALESTEVDGAHSRSTHEHERVEGEKLPNFGSLGDDDSSLVKVETEEDKSKKAEEAAAAAKKAEEEAAAKAKASKGKKPAEKPAEQPAKKDKEPAAADAGKEAEKEAKAGKKIATPAKSETKIPDDDKDVDAMRPRHGASAADEKSFGEMREIIKATRSEARALIAKAEAATKELEEVKAKAGELPPEVQEERKEYQRVINTFKAKESEHFKTNFEAPIKAAEDKLFAALEANGLKKEVIDQIKAAGVQKWGRWTGKEGLFAKIEDPLLSRQLQDLFIAHGTAETARDNRLTELTGDQEKFAQEMNAQELESNKRFGKAAIEATIELTAGHEFILERDPEPNASKEVQEAIAEHNEKTKVYAKQWNENVVAAYKRDPEKTAEIAFKAVLADRLQEELGDMELDRDRLAARVKDLEGKLASRKQAGRMAHVETPPNDQKAESSKSAAIGGDGRAAMDSFFGKED